MVCVGQDGHVGFGPATEAGSCPCVHESATDADRMAAPAKNEDGHPPCYDIALDLPVVLRDAGLVQKRSSPAETPSDDHPPATAVWMIDGSWLEKHGWHRSGATSPAARPRQLLAHQRTVVLLI